MASDQAWRTRIEVDDNQTLSALRASDLPLSAENSEIVCIAEVRQDNIRAFIACPSGIMYQIDPPEFDLEFWKFAACNYYWLTGNMADRRYIAAMCGVTDDDMKGRAITRTKDAELSGMTLDDLMSSIGAEPADRQFVPMTIQQDMFTHGDFAPNRGGRLKRPKV